MPAFSGVAAARKQCWSVLLVLALLEISAAAQTSLNDVHVMPRPASSTIASSVGSLELVGGSYLHVIKKDVTLVLVSVSVTDPMQRLVTGLAPENFQVFEGKTPQEIRHFSSEDAPVSVGIILDSSGSMSDKMDRVREAVNQFCQAANPQDEFFLITFADQPLLASDFTGTPEDLQTAILYTQPKGRTSLLDAIYMGIGKMRRAKYAKKALFIISDGGDNHSRYGQKEVLSAVKESDVMVYSIGVFDRSVPTREEWLGPELLRSIAEPSGGRAFTVFNARELPAVAHRIGTELRTQYVIGYRPEKAPGDGKWHKISVKLKLPRKLAFLQAHFRKGYYAQSNEPVATLPPRPEGGSPE
jgi:Ca-activated chloride channel family protein